MNEKQLGRALLSLDAVPNSANLDPRTLAHNIVRRDERRIRYLTWVTAGCWVAATGGIIWLATLYFIVVEPRLIAYSAGRAQLEADWQDWARAGDLAARSLLACLAVLLLAAISSVLLILQTRRATLRQINASLAELTVRLTPVKKQDASADEATTTGTKEP